jgi:ribokinase
VSLEQSEIVVVGSCNVDLITYTARFPKVGETIEGTDFKQGFGGKGANQAVAAAKFGARVSMVGRLGMDGFGTQTLENFKTQNVDASFVTQLEGVPSGVAPIFVNAQGQNFIVIVSGANAKLEPEDLEPAKELLIHAKFVICQLEIKQQTVLEAFRIARAAGVKTILNPAPAAPLLPGLLELTDLLLPNETELELLTGKPVTNVLEARDAARALILAGAKEVIVTLGERGALHVTSERALHHQPRAVKAVDSTGAGDAFIGALVSALSRGLEMSRAIEFANVAAAVSVMRTGTQTSFATLEELKLAPPVSGGLVEV